MAIRHEYSDSLPGARSIHPQTNARGQYDGGIGSVCTIITDPGTRLDEPHDPYDFPGDEGPPEQEPGPTEKPHCIEVDWPGKSLWPTMERQSRWHTPNHWSGSLLMHSRDPSGQYYRRNRFYDAGSGRFTQEDPIGIAGGLNVYGYANGDPITYSDPYGLSAETKGSDGEACPKCVAFILRSAPVAGRLGFAVAASSRVLGTNLRRAGMVQRAGHAAHHIVPGRARRFPSAVAARDRLAQFDIGINNAVNGVFLPNNGIAAVRTGSAYHRTLHTRRYYDAVNTALQRASNRQEALDVLSSIRDQLVNNTFPH